MTELILVRHGQTDWNKKNLIQGHADIPLNEIGIEQAKQTAKNFNPGEFVVIFSSPLIRAKQTASIIAEAIGYEGQIHENDALIERNFGCADGKLIKEYFPSVLRNEIEDMEKDEALKIRAIGALKGFASLYPNQKILVVCHSHVIKAILSTLEPKQYNFGYRLANASITTCHYEHEKDVFRLENVNINMHI